MKVKFVCSLRCLLFFLPLMLIFSCGQSIKNAQDFTPNKAPTVTEFTAQYIGTDTGYDTSKLYSGMPFLITVNAHDPEGKQLTYEIASSQGTFTSQVVTDTGITCKFYIGTISASDSVSIALTVTDPKKAEFVQTLNIGTGKTGPGLSIIPPSTSIITPGGDTTFSFSCDSKGTYRVYLDNSITTGDAAKLGTSGLALYTSENSNITVPIVGPLSTRSDGVQVKSGEKNYIWVVFQDSNSLSAATFCNMTVEGDNPYVVSTSPEDGDSSAGTLPSISLLFSKTLNPATVNTSSITLKSFSGTAVAGTVSYDASTYTAVFTPSSALSYGTRYTVSAGTSITDNVSSSGNPMLDTYSFSFTTVAEGVLSRPALSPIAGTYTGAQSVSISSGDPDASIAYTTDGTNPIGSLQPDGSYKISNGTLYAGAIPVSANKTVRAIAFKTGTTASAVAASAYSIRTMPPSFSFTQNTSQIAAGTGAGTLSITASSPIYYTVDGSDPSGSGGQLLGSDQVISIDKNITVRVITRASGMTDSAETTETWKVKTAAPTFSIADGATLSNTTDLTLSCESGAVIYYTITRDTSEPADPLKFPTVYSWKIPLEESSGNRITYKVRAVSVKSGMQTSSVSNVMTYYVNSGTAAGVTFSPAGGLFTAVQNVTLSSPTAGATIYYTTDGTEPTASSSVYGSPITLGAGTSMVTIKAFAVMTGMSDSPVTKSSYVIDAKVTAPVFATVSSSAIEPSIVVSCDTTGATIYYTTDGTDPLIKGTAISSGSKIAVSDGTLSGGITTLNVKAIAVKTGLNNSSLSFAAYTYSFASGTAHWAETVNTTPSSTSQINAVATDSSGNIYAVGYITGTGTFKFSGINSSTVEVSGISTGNNAVIIKYAPSGYVLWAKSVSSASSASLFKGVAVDSGGNIYAAGYINGNGSACSYTFAGTSLSATVTGGNTGSLNNAVIVKYSSDGSALWANSTGSGAAASNFYGVSVDSSGNCFVVGIISGQAANTFSGVNSNATVAAAYSSDNAVIVKYSADGSAKWARSTQTGYSSSASYFNGVTATSAGTIYAVGRITGTYAFYFAGANSSTVSVANTFSSGYGAAIVAFDTDGNALWANSPTTAPAVSMFNGVAVDSSGSIYAAGTITGATQFIFTGASSSSASVTGVVTGTNAVIVKYGSTGSVSWARSVSAASYISAFNTVTVDPASGGIYAAGTITGTGGTSPLCDYTFAGTSSSASVSGAYKGINTNAAIVKYSSDGSAVWAKSTTIANLGSSFLGVSCDLAGNVYSAGWMNNSSTTTGYSFGGYCSTLLPGGQATNPLLVKYQP